MRLAPRPTLRARLTALYVLLFGVSGALLTLVIYWLLQRHLDRTLPAPQADDVLEDVALQLALAFGGTLLLAGVAGWLVAGRALAPVAAITAAARRVSDRRLDHRIALGGPDDELRELADTFDAMLDRLAESFDAQRRFVANASHELRSPLTVIRTEADVALADPDARVEDLRAMGEAVLEGTRRTEALLDSLLTLARSQRALLRRERVDLAAAARVAAGTVAADAEASGVSLALSLEAAPVDGDRRLLERLLANLLENGVRYNRHGGTVALRTWSSGEHACVEVTNPGEPVDAAALARIVEPFERLGRRADERSAGLGLSIVRTVVDAHGGALDLDAPASGGLTVRVELPRV